MNRECLRNRAGKVVIPYRDVNHGGADVVSILEANCQAADDRIALLEEELAATSMMLTTDLAAATTGQLKAEARIIELEVRVVDAIRRKQQAQALQDTAEAKLVAMTATMQQWRDLAGQQSAERYATLENYKLCHQELGHYVGMVADLQHECAAANERAEHYQRDMTIAQERRISTEGALDAAMIRNEELQVALYGFYKPEDPRKPWDDARGLDEPEPLPWEEEDDYRAG